MPTSFTRISIPLRSFFALAVMVAIVCHCGDACLACDAHSSPEQVSAPEIKATEGGKCVEFAPGVVIDWPTRTVEVFCIVVMRDGPLELFVCSPNTREHESILVSPARPLHIYQALGLLGLEPGTPVGFDRKKGEPIPPTGAALSMHARYEVDGKQTTVPLHNWLVSMKTREPVERVNWVFSGSRWVEKLFMADEDGTIACLVDFSTALISVGSLHSASNSELWVGANPKEIPPVGTKCSLLIRELAPEPIRVAVMPDGGLRLDGEVVSTRAIAEKVRALFPGDQEEGKGKDKLKKVWVVLEVSDGCSAATMSKVVEELSAAGVDRSRVQPAKPGK